MTEPFLLQFIDKVYKNCLDYCVICLRTSQERKLEKPNHLKKFIQNISNLDQQCFKFNQSHQLVCFVCESQAAAALRFLTALSLTMQAHVAVEQLIQLPASRFQFHSSYLQYLLTNPQPDACNMGAPESMLNLESKLWKHRLKTQLLQTEVLVVSTPSAGDCLPELPAEVPTSECAEISKPGESSDLYVIPDLIPTTQAEQNINALNQPEQEIKVESILIFDDDDPISTDTGAPVNSVRPRLGTINPLKGKSVRGIEIPQRVTASCRSELVPSRNKVIARFKKKPSIRVTPIVSPKPKVVENTRKINNTKEAGVVPIAKLVEKQTEAPPVFPSTSFILHPIVFNSGMLTVPSLTANIMEGKLVTSGSNTLTFETPELAFQNDGNIEFLIDPLEVTSILKNLSHQDTAKFYIFKPFKPEAEINDSSTNTVTSDKVAKAPSICTVSEPRSLENDDKKLPNNGVIRFIRSGESGAKPADGKTLICRDQINWEDKIPMDVISFVDDQESICKRARNSEPLPPLGISNVTSLSHEEVIDLC